MQDTTGNPQKLRHDMANDSDFWARLDHLVHSYPLRIDRPRGSRAARYPDFVYPNDYGYLEGTCSGDGEGIDVWVGSLPTKSVTGALCTVDLKERDAEVKILLGCTPAEAQEILAIHNRGLQSAILLERPTGAS